jgi:hypothetical protein
LVILTLKNAPRSENPVAAAEFRFLRYSIGGGEIPATVGPGTQVTGNPTYQALAPNQWQIPLSHVPFKKQALDRPRGKINDSWNPECQSGSVFPATFPPFSTDSLIH